MISSAEYFGAPVTDPPVTDPPTTDPPTTDDPAMVDFVENHVSCGVSPRGSLLEALGDLAQLELGLAGRLVQLHPKGGDGAGLQRPQRAEPRLGTEVAATEPRLVEGRVDG